MATAMERGPGIGGEISEGKISAEALDAIDDSFDRTAGEEPNVRHERGRAKYDEELKARAPDLRAGESEEAKEGAALMKAEYLENEQEKMAEVMEELRDGKTVPEILTEEDKDGKEDNTAWAMQELGKRLRSEADRSEGGNEELAVQAELMERTGEAQLYLLRGERYIKSMEGEESEVVDNLRERLRDYAEREDVPAEARAIIQAAHDELNEQFPVRESGAGSDGLEKKSPAEVDSAIEWQYERDFFTDYDKHDDRLYERSQQIEDSLQQKLPDDLVRNVDNLIVRRLRDHDDPQKAGESEIDRSIARVAGSEGEPDNNPLKRLEMDLRSEDGGKGMTLDRVVKDLKGREGEERQERIKAVQVFGTAMRQEVMKGKEWDEVSEEQKLLARTAEDFKLQGDLAEAEDILKGDSGNDAEARKLALAMAVEFDSYRENNDIRGKLQADLEYTAVRLRRFARGGEEVREEKRGTQLAIREPDKVVLEGEVIEGDEDSASEEDIVDADFEVEERAKVGVDYGYNTERYVSIVEKMSEDAEGREVLKARGQAVDQMMTGESQLPAGIKEQLDRVDFLPDGRDKQAEGSAVKLIPDRYFKDRDMQGRVKRIVEELRNGEAPDDCIKEIRSRRDRRDLAALKIVGARIIQERVPKEGEWSELPEKEKVALRLGEEIVHQAEMAALEESLNKGDLTADTAETFYHNYRSYLNNEDISAARRSNLRRMSHLLREKAGIKDSTAEKDVQAEGENKVEVAGKKAEKVRAKAPKRERQADTIDEQAYPKRAAFEKARKEFENTQDQTAAALNVKPIRSCTEKELKQKEKRVISRLTHRRLSKVMYEKAMAAAMKVLKRGEKLEDEFEEKALQILKRQALENDDREERRQRYLEMMWDDMEHAGSVEGSWLEKNVSARFERVVARWKVSGRIANWSIKGRQPEVIDTREDAITTMREAAVRGDVDSQMRVFLDQMADELELLNVRETMRLGKSQGGKETGVEKEAAVNQQVEAAETKKDEAIEAEGKEEKGEKKTYYYEGTLGKGEKRTGYVKARSARKAGKKLEEMGWKIEKLELVEDKQSRAA